MNTHALLLHMILLVWVLTIYFLLIVCSANVLAADQDSATTKRGWNWYEDPIVPEPLNPDIAAKPHIPSIADLKRMTPEAVGRILENQLAYAIASENVREVADYYRLLDFVRRRSRTFTSLTSVALLQNPGLNARAGYPVTNAGRTVKSRERKEERDERLILESRGYALIMFSSEGCGFCTVMWNSIRSFKDRTGWTIRRLDINEFPGRAARFNVQATPMTVLIKKGSDAWFPIAVGVESLPVIADNAYRAIRLLSGEISQQQFLSSESDVGGFFDPAVTVTEAPNHQRLARK